MGDQESLFAAAPELAGAIFDPTRRYRYRLWRRWADGPAAVWIMLNPSTADETTLDNTLRRCIAFSIRWGYAAMEIVNLNAYRSTEPAALATVVDPIGRDNLQHIEDVVRDAGIVVLGWGSHAQPEAVQPVLELLRRHGIKPHCLSTNDNGSPGHPLYLSKRLDPVPWIAAQTP